MRRRRLPAIAWPALIVWLLVTGQTSGQVDANGQTAVNGQAAATLQTPPGTFTVGDIIELKLSVTHPAGAVFDYPDVAGAFSHATEPPAGAEPPEPKAEGVASLMVEEVKPSERDTVPGRTVWSIRLRVFSPGPHRLPAITLGYRLAGSAEKQVVSTEPVTITVASVLKSKEDVSADIKGPWHLPRQWWPWLIGGALVLAFVALLVYLRRRYRRKPRPIPVPAPAPVLPAEHPYDRALRELNSLLSSTLLAEGRVKEFHVVLSEIVKRFLGSIHRFDALDMTTEELMADLRVRDLTPGLAEETGRLLRAADLVKFAKHHPARAEIDQTVESARRIIETGRPAPASAGSGVAA